MSGRCLVENWNLVEILELRSLTVSTMSQQSNCLSSFSLSSFSFFSNFEFSVLLLLLLLLLPDLIFINSKTWKYPVERHSTHNEAADAGKWIDGCIPRRGEKLMKMNWIKWYVRWFERWTLNVTVDNDWWRRMLLLVKKKSWRAPTECIGQRRNSNQLTHCWKSFSTGLWLPDVAKA